MKNLIDLYILPELLELYCFELFILTEKAKANEKEKWLHFVQGFCIDLDKQSLKDFD